MIYYRNLKLIKKVKIEHWAKFPKSLPFSIFAAKMFHVWVRYGSTWFQFAKNTLFISWKTIIKIQVLGLLVYLGYMHYYTST